MGWTRVAVLGVVLLVAGCGVEADGRHVGGVALSRDQLIVTSRDRLAICVKPVEGATADLDLVKGHVEAGLQTLATDARWHGRGLDKAPPVVEANCSEEPILLRPDVRVIIGTQSSSLVIPDRPVVTQPSAYTVIIFLLPDLEIKRLFFGWSPWYRREVEARWCKGKETASQHGDVGDDDCTAVTFGEYLTPDEAMDQQVVLKTLQVAFGMYDPPPNPAVTGDVPILGPIPSTTPRVWP